MKKMAVALLMLILSVPGCACITEQMPEIGLLPKIHEFGATPPVIELGEIAYLRWSVSNADTVFIDNGIGGVALRGTMPVSPNNTTLYTLTARNFAGEATARTQIIVRGTPTAQLPVATVTQPVIVSFYADRLVTTPGGTVTLSWDVLGASEVTLSSIGRVNARDTVTVSPASTTTYVLTATNTAGKSEAGITITVQTSLPSAPKGEGMVVLTAIPEESGALVRGTGYLDYIKYDNACAGDTSLNLASRAFLSFDISSIPRNALIKEAILDLSNHTKHGDPTYRRSIWGNMGALEVYHIQYSSFEGLGFAEYTAMAKLTANGTFTEYPISPWAWDVKDSNDGEPVIQNLVRDGIPRCQFRIQFFTTTNWDSVMDMLCFDNATLTIRYVTTE